MSDGGLVTEAKPAIQWDKVAPYYCGSNTANMSRHLRVARPSTS